MKNFELPLFLIGIAWVQELIDQVFFGGTWNILISKGSQWWTVLLSSFSHSGFEHLTSNTFFFLPLSFLVLVKGVKSYASIWLVVILFQFFQIAFVQSASHGISGIIFGLFGYLFIIGAIEKKPLSIVITILTIIFYGQFIISLFPWSNPEGISWISHFLGFCGGLITALFSKDINKNSYS